MRRRVVVVGGGLAGLSAAEALSRCGSARFEVTLLEAKRITGGRAGSFSDPASGETVDYCQHVAMGCCTNLLALLERCGLGDTFDRYRQLQFFHPDHPPSRFAPARTVPPPFHLAAALGSLRFLSRSDKRQIAAAMWTLIRTPPAALRDQVARQWLSRHRQSDQTIRRFWDVILISALGEQTDRVSMEAARKVFIDGFAAARNASDVLVPNRPLSELFGQRLPESINQLGARIETSAAFSRIIATGTQIEAVETQSGHRFDADHLISAVPWHAVSELISQLPSPAAEQSSNFPVDQFASSPITGVHLWFDRSITNWPHAVMVGTTAQWLFRQPYRRPSSDTGHYYQVVISASRTERSQGKQSLVQEILAELRHAFPAARQAELLAHRIVTDPHSVFSVSPEVQRLRPPARTPLPWFHLAGDWIATGWPATMEGAVISGRMAAASVLESEGLPASIAIDPGLPRGWLARRLIVT